MARPSINKATPRGFCAAVFILATSWFVLIAYRTCADEDEGFYAIAGELTAHGQVVYKDFFYPQMPLVPALLAPVATLHSFRADRVFTGVIAGAVAAVLASYVLSATGSPTVSAFAAAVLCVHELSWQWMPVVKTYGLTSLFAMLALLWTGRGMQSARRADWILGGMASALSVGCRLLAAATLLVPILAALAHCFRRDRSSKPDTPGGVKTSPARASDLSLYSETRRLLSGAPALVALGIILGFLPVGCYALLSPENFIVGNVEVHSQRAPGGLFGADIFGSLLMFFGVRHSTLGSAAGPQFVVLLSLATAAFCGPMRNNVALIVAWLVALLFTNALPNPVHEQYFVLMCPGFAALAAFGVAQICKSCGPRTQYVLPISIIVFLAALGYRSWSDKWLYGNYGPWNLLNRRPSAIDSVARKACAVLPAGGQILPRWPGHALGCATRIVDGFENSFSRILAGHATPAQRAQWHVAGDQEFAILVKNRSPAVLVVNPKALDISRDYEKEMETGDVTVYRRR